MPAFPLSSLSSRFPLLMIVAWVWLTSLTGFSQQIDITAEGKASQSTEYNGGAFPAAHAVDGDTTTFSHTDVKTAGNHWLLTFNSELQISRIEVVAREDCCGGRLTNAVLRIADDEGETVFTENITDPGQGGTATFTLPEATFGKNVRIGFEEEQTNSEGNRVVHLAEVRVFGGEAEKLAILSFKAEPDSISSGGQTTLSWATEHADSVMIVGIGDVPTSGSVDLNLASSTLYTLVATAQGQTVLDTTGIAVDGVPFAPRISEFMAAPAEGADWIELQNPNNAPLSLDGYGLTDRESGEPWLFPAETVIEANGFLIIEAGLDDSSVPFGLARANGEYIALIAPDGTVVSEYVYPEQRSGVSYGLAPDGEVRYFLIPSRGSANGFGVAGFVADTAFSVDRGFYQQPFELTITSATEGAAVWFTVDGTKPSPDNPGASRFLAPLAIDRSTVVRAVAYWDGWQPTNIDTQTYLFLADVVRQPEEPEGFPTSWGNGPGVQSTMPARADYEMDPRVVNAAPFTDLEGEEFSMEDALLAIPTMSLVMDIDELLDPVDGLHARARNRGIAWEREASVEIIDPAADRAVQANCGIRMQGGWNRFPEMLKKSFRLYFRGEYGDGKLRYPLFPDSDVDAFDRLVLRSGNGKAWPSPWRALSGGGNSLPRTTYLRDQFVRDTQRALGGETAHGMFVHLYINGLYWGLYNPCERLDEKFAAAHFGGEAENWDVVKWIRGNGGLQLVAGTTDPWNELMRRVRRNPSDPANYAAVLELLDPVNLADYMIANMYAGNIDWQDNNSYAMRNRAGDGRFRFSSWDAEETFLSPGDNTSTQNVSNTATELFTRLRANDEFRLLFADRLQRHYFDGGALSPEIAESRWLEMAVWIDRAVVGESARWGDLMRPSRPYTRDIDWVKEIENIRSSYIGAGRSSNRTTATFSQFARLKLYPDLSPPAISDPAGGVVEESHVVRLENPEGQEATLYFTTDGTDPRDPGGKVSATSQIFSGGVVSNIVINASNGDVPGSIWKFHDTGTDLSDSGWNDPGYDDSAWQAGPSELGYGDRDEETTVSFGDDAGQKPITTWFRHSFELSAIGVASIDRVVELSARIKVDDGAIVYLNGTEVARFFLPEGPISAETPALSGGDEKVFFDTGAIPASLLRAGTNVVAVEVHQVAPTNSDISFDLELTAKTLVENAPAGVVIDRPLVLKTRAFDGEEWSALREATFSISSLMEGLAITEIFYHPGGDYGAATEFIELSNLGTRTVSLDGVGFSAGVLFDFTGSAVTQLTPGDRVLVVRDLVAFRAAFPQVPESLVAGEFADSTALSNGGERIALSGPVGESLIDFSYGTSAPWPDSADGGGYSLTLAEPVSAGSILPDPALAENWKASARPGGTPGTAEAAPSDLLAQFLGSPLIVEPDAASGKVSISFIRNPDTVDSTFGFETSLDLENWESAALELSSETALADGSTRLVYLWQEAENLLQYLRLRVSR